jgi:hypothetical protein
MALALSRSYMMWNDCQNYPLYLFTDWTDKSCFQDLHGVHVVQLPTGQYGKGFSPKLHLDKIAPSPKSLFIDADCLVVGSVKKAFRNFNGHAVSAIGREIHDGDWFGDIEKICKIMQIPSMPRFNGGVYYLERGESCGRVFDKARELESQYDELGFLRLRGCPNDEVLISLAMALSGQSPIPERGDIMNSLMAGPAGVNIDVFHGTATLLNTKGHPKHNPWYEQERLTPMIVHFAGCQPDHHPYADEILKMSLYYDWKMPKFIANVSVKLFVTWPAKIKTSLKEIFRPVYRMLFGVRALKSNPRF